MPVEFILRREAKIEQVISMNNSQKNWQTEDFLNSFVDKSNEDYIKLNKLYNKHREFKITLLIAIAQGMRAGTLKSSHLDEFKKGNFTFTTDEDIIEEYMEFYNNLINDTLLKPSFKIQNISWTFFTAKNFNPDRMIRKINEKNIADVINLTRYESNISEMFMDAYKDKINENSKDWVHHFYDNNKKLQLPHKKKLTK